MTTSLRSEIVNGDRISEGTRVYFEERLKHRIFELIAKEFEKKITEVPSFTRSALAKRSGKSAAQITRFFEAPSNSTISTISDYLLGISGAELVLSVSYVNDQTKKNYRKPEWLETNESSNSIELTPAKQLTIPIPPTGSITL